jgi:hypothetical protein
MSLKLGKPSADSHAMSNKKDPQRLPIYKLDGFTIDKDIAVKTSPDRVPLLKNITRFS